MIRRILLLFLLMELGVIGWFFQKETQLEGDMDHGVPQEFRESEVKGTQEAVQEDSMINGEELKQLLEMVPELFSELLQFGKLQNEVISSDLLEELDKLQLEAGSSLDLNENGLKEIMTQLLEDPENKEAVRVYYEWLKEQLEDHKEKINEVINQEDSFHEERVSEMY
ncbi:hypothetical protein [Bacillus sp. AK128]